MTAIVERLYGVFLERQSDTAGRQFFEAQEAQGNNFYKLAKQVVTSNEFGDLLRQDPNKAIDRLYSGLLDRTPDEPGRAFFLDLIRKGESVETVFNRFVTSEEFASKHPEGVPIGLFKGPPPPPPVQVAAPAVNQQPTGLPQETINRITQASRPGFTGLTFAMGNQIANERLGTVVGLGPQVLTADSAQALSNQLLPVVKPVSDFLAQLANSLRDGAFGGTVQFQRVNFARQLQFRIKDV